MRKQTSIAVLILLLLLGSSYFVFRYKPQLTQTLSPIISQHEEKKPLILSSVDQIFQEDHSWTATLSAEKKVVMVVTGDIIPARSVNYYVTVRNNPLWPYEKVKAGLDAMQPDITFINLETPLLKNCPVTNEGMIFCGSHRNVEGLTYINTTIANVANNHAGNYGEEGVKETLELLHTNNIETIGTNGALYKTVKGTRFAFLGYNDITKDQPGVVDVDFDRIKNDIAEARKNADIVIVTYHWGVEYRAQPDEDQKRIGRFTIDSGADLVIGNHPHWIQPVEFYKGKLITYAHGNFVFDQMWSQKTREGVVGKYTFYENQLVDVQYFPIQIDDYGQPHFVDETQRKRILEEMKQESEILKKSN